MLAGYKPDFVGDFGKVLVLAEDKGNIVFLSRGEADEIQRQADIHALFAPNEDGNFGAVRQVDGFIAVAQKAPEHVDALPSHLGELGIPEVVPERIVGYVGDTGVEADLVELPSLTRTDALIGKCFLPARLYLALRG